MEEGRTRSRRERKEGAGKTGQTGDRQWETPSAETGEGFEDVVSYAKANLFLFWLLL